MDPNFTAQLNTILEQFLQASDTQQIRALTATLNKDFYSQPASVPALTEIATKEGTAWQLRQLAAVELRKRVLKLWQKVGDDIRAGIQKHLLECVVREPEAPVRHTLARVISAVAELDLPLNRWDDLLPLLFQLSNSTDAGQRETGIYVLYTIFEVIADGELSASQHMPGLFNLFAKAIHDPDSRAVRVITLQALGKVAEFLEPENAADIKTFRDLVPSMVKVIQDCLAYGDEEGFGHGFEVFDSLLELETPLLTNHFADLIRFYLDVASNRDYPESVRRMSLSFISVSAMFKRKRLQKANLVTPIIERLFPIIAEDDVDSALSSPQKGANDAGDDDDDDDDDDEKASSMALSTLSSMSTYLSATAVFPPTLRLVLEYMQNPRPAARKAAMLSFAVTVEWSVDLIADKVGDLLRLVVAGLQDPAQSVRRAACMAMATFADHFDQDITAHHTTLLPIIFTLMGDTHADVIKHSCNALDVILEGMGDNVVQYLPTLLQGLLQLLENSPTKVRITVTAAIGSAAHAAGEAFLPYFQDVIQRLHHLFSLSSAEDDYALRGIALDTVGSVAEAVGKEVFRPHLETFVKLGLESMELPSARMRDCSYLFFGTVGNVFRDEMAPYLQFIVPALLQSCRTDETQVVEDDQGNLTLAASLANGEEEDGMDDEVDPFYVSTALADEKEVAADVLGELFEATSRHFLPYTEATVQELVKLIEHDADGVRTASVSALFKCLVTIYRMSLPQDRREVDPTWEAGLPLRQPVDSNVAQLIQIMMPAVVNMWTEEDQVTVVIQFFHEFSQALKVVGPALLAFSLPNDADTSSNDQTPTEAVITTVCNELGRVFQKEALCQEDDLDEDNQLDEEDKAKRDAMLISGAADVVGALALALGPDFATYFQAFFPFMAAYYAPNQDVSERSMAIGCLGEAVSGIKEGCDSLTKDLLTLFVKALDDPDSEVRSNATFATGVTVSYSSMDLTEQYPMLLQMLHRVFSHSGKDNPKNVYDNACGALARVAMKNPQAVPLADMVTVLVQHLPLKADFEENEPVMDFVCGLLADGHPAVQPHVAALKAVLQHVLNHADEQLKSTQLTKVQSILQAMP
ncbi:hypothetical protein IWQ61_006328 [Dispira simplex]|nr:hypothetical protein IWQ61_006328 [Dispira simplex]